MSVTDFVGPTTSNESRKDRFCFDLTRVFFVFVCLRSLRLSVGLVCFSLFKDSCVAHESAQACFAFVKSTR